MEPKQLNNIPISRILSDMGYTPGKEYSTYYMYYSPFRKENIASFQVKKQSNTWHDYGTGESGTAIDLVMRMQSCNFHEALLFLKRKTGLPGTDTTGTSPDRPFPKLEVIQLKAITSPPLLDYISKRGIQLVNARNYCQQIEFRTGAGKYYSGISFQNNSGGYEIRNPWFKGCTQKDITHFNHQSEKCTLFEGFFDFLSYLELYPEAFHQTDVIVLNSLNLLKTVLPAFTRYKTIDCFLDNDKSGELAIRKLQLYHPTIRNHAQALYPSHKDLNDYLVHTRTK